MATLHFDPEDYLDEVHLDDLLAEIASRERPFAVPRGMGEGDPTNDRLIEEGFLALKALPKPPRALVDLFWHVHGRAM